ncbi:formate dehydrogenase subunit alpha [Desulfosarcina ovata subsp. sediminis]|uniref:Formate dehydrogenase subunit alpha n=1 Tax=Desulfosarcina ovata subsp. sediminis TaxID=885957 RepID=A0A5K7ZPI2_9BACT|nr:formate dehydrogenase subunit alpha [Desulfosarcina ovata]BBO80860.1 formate dehydrogenase subunit alpha [Desulfosarcina ovata subsp. sediminis]
MSQTLLINGNEFPFSTGETILDVATRNHIDIPTLCHLKDATPTGACRICVVEVIGSRTLLTACTTPATSGMRVMTESSAVVEARRNIIELMLGSGNHNCAIRTGNDSEWSELQVKVAGEDMSGNLCPVWGDCRLQDLAYRYQVSTAYMDQRPTRYPMETANPFIVRDFSRCIQCGRCVQACNEIQVNNAIQFGYRGKDAKIITAGNRALKDSDCVFCGECVQACPVGALVEKDVRYVVRPWETKKVRTTCSYCGVGCQLYLHVKDNRVVKVSGVDAAPNHGRLCVKGRFGYHFIGSSDRLTQPLIKENGAFRKASWDEALDYVAQRLSAIRDSSGPDSLCVLSSARMTNEDNYLAQKFARGVLGTNNVDHCARLCHASTVAGLAASFGSGAMTNPIADLSSADVILVTGSNTTETHPVTSTYIKRAVRSGKAQLIVVDPRDIPLSRHAALKLTQKPGTDVAWINGLMHVIIEEELHDADFIQTRTEGFDAFKASLAPYTPEAVSQITGIPADKIVAAARMYAKAKVGNIVYCMGITQHSTGTDNVKALANLAMLCGNLGIEGGGVNPLRGQNNVQGACDMGCLPNVYSGYQAVTDPAVAEKMAAAWNAGNLSLKMGLKATEMIPKALSGEIKALYIIGENPMVSDPDLNHAQKCLESLDLLVVQDIFLTETAQLAEVVLPATCFAEKEGTFTNTERKVQRVRPAVPPPGQARDDWSITADLATRMGVPMQYADAEAVFREISQVTPSYAGISYPRIDADGLVWPCPTPDHPGTPILHIGRFTSGLGKFHAVEYLPPAEEPDDQFPFTLTTGRLLYHYHTGTMTMKSDDLNDRAPECRIEIADSDALRIGVADGDMLSIRSRRGAIQARAALTPSILPGTVFIPFHFAAAAANRLTNAALDPVCAIPELKVCAVALSPKGAGVDAPTS